MSFRDAVLAEALEPHLSKPPYTNAELEHARKQRYYPDQAGYDAMNQALERAGDAGQESEVHKLKQEIAALVERVAGDLNLCNELRAINQRWTQIAADDRERAIAAEAKLDAAEAEIARLKVERAKLREFAIRRPTDRTRGWTQCAVCHAVWELRESHRADCPVPAPPDGPDQARTK